MKGHGSKFGRKSLGHPTMFPVKDVHAAVQEAAKCRKKSGDGLSCYATGVYRGYASLGSRPVICHSAVDKVWIPA
jgi:hypothetical protein